MGQRLTQLTIVVHAYDDAITFWVDAIGFELVEDTDLGEGKRWVRVRPRGTDGAGILLARAVTDEQRAAVGHQTGGRVCAFFETDSFWEDVDGFRARGVRFAREPVEQPYGMVVVFEDLYGNRFDLIGRGTPPR